MKRRLDQLLVDLGHAPTRTRAQALILAGDVLIADQPASKAGQLVSEDDAQLIRLRKKEHGYVSRGALKLIAALDAFAVDPSDKVALDFGASTGGFTQVLLERGAAKIFALDVGTNQLDWKLRSDPRVVALEKTHIRTVTFEALGVPVDLVTIDVSFISLTKVLEPTLQFAKPETQWITLIKPQFELTPEKIGKGGIVRDPAFREEAIVGVIAFAESKGWVLKALIESPITGTDGNQEKLALWERSR